MAIPVLRGERVTLRPLEEAHLDAVVRLIQASGVAEWWWESGDADRLRGTLPNDGRAFIIEVGGRLAGWLGFDEEEDPGYRHASVDISLDPRFHGQGHGPDAIRTVIRWLAAERGHDRFTIDPAAHNERAIAAYRRVGFKPVGLMRRYEAGPDGTRHDGLLMDLLIEELT